MLFSGVSFQLGTPSMIYECHFRWKLYENSKRFYLT
jgi:hypothetical protein